MGLEDAIPVDGYLTTQMSRVINWGTTFKCLAHAFCNCLLWHRVNGYSIKPIRSCTFWGRSFSFQSKTSGFNDCGRESFCKDDASLTTHLPSNDRAQMGDINGRMCFYRWRIRHVWSRAGSRPIHASRCVCPRVPPKTRNANRGCNGNPEDHRRRQYPVRRGWQTTPTRSRTSIVFCRANRCDNQSNRRLRRPKLPTPVQLSDTTTCKMVAA